MSKNSRMLGLTSNPIVSKWGKGESVLAYETRRLIKAGREVYGNVFLINPFLVAVELPRGEETPLLFHNGLPMPKIDSLIVRSTHRLGDGLSALLRCLVLRGCDILDPVGRQGHSKGSKLTTSIKRFNRGVGSTTFLAFSKSAAMDLVKRLGDSGQFPLVGKPIAGKGGKGVTRLDNPDDLLKYVKNFYGRKQRATLLLQPFEEFINEFRVMVFFGRSLGIARKIAADGSVAANVTRGGTFVKADRSDIVDYALKNSDSIGILGVDVGETAQGKFRIIEANRAPKWQAFDEALNCDTAKEIVTLAFERLD
jgi:hypothetical protein